MAPREERLEGLPEASHWWIRQSLINCPITISITEAILEKASTPPKMHASVMDLPKY